MSHGLAGSAGADAGAFLTRLVRVDAAALVRLRPAGPDLLTLWAHLPWGVLVTRTLPGVAPGDVTVSARALLATLAGGDTALPARQDARWRWPLPGTPSVVERVPAAQIRDLSAAAERAVRAALAGAVRLGERAVRDVFLDHVAIVVEADPSTSGGSTTPAVQDEMNSPIEIPQRLVQAVVRMGFLRRTPGDDEPTVRVLRAGRFVGLSAEYGVAWYRSATELAMEPITRTAEPGQSNS